MPIVVANVLRWFRATVAAVTVTCFRAKGAEDMKLDVSPTNALVDEPFGVRVTEAEPGSTVVLQAAALAPDGTEWASRGTYRTDAQGVVDLSRDTPGATSTYGSTDPMGLIWSMAPTDGSPRRFGTNAKLPFSVRISATPERRSRDSRVEVSLTRRFLGEDVIRSDVRDKGLIGTFFAPRGVRHRPSIILLGGSAGGLAMEPMAALYASRGFPVFAVAYFKFEGLAQRLLNFPLEYFALAIQWIQARPEVDPDRIGMTGTSKGAEATLLLASMFPEIKCIVPIVGTSIVFGVRAVAQSGGSPWSYRGVPVPHVPMPDFEAAAGSDPARPLRVTSAFREAMTQTDAVIAATIPAERTNAAILLLSGEDDGTWPSADLSRMVMERLGEKRHARPRKHVCFKGAGHVMAPPHWPASSTISPHPENKGMWLTVGGTPEMNAAAMAGAWKEQLEWFRERL
jgi:dienelactone hydrolase